PPHHPVSTLSLHDALPICLFHTLGLEAGVLRRWDHPDGVYLIVQTKGLMTGGSTKGYAYSERVLEPRCDSLDKPEAIIHTEIYLDRKSTRLNSSHSQISYA